MAFEALAEELSKIFLDKGYTWKIQSGESVVPDKDALLIAFNQVEARLKNEPSGTRLEVGHLVIVKFDDFYDVYVHIGTVNKEI
jgi:hypothetical protein